MTCQEFEEISGAYALDAVSPAEKAAAKAHLATCAHCTQLLQELRAVVAFLPLSVAPMDPPVSLEARLLAAIQQESRDVTRQATLQIRSIPAGQAAQERSVSPQSIQNARHTRRAGWNVRILAVAAVLMLALLGMGAWNISLQQQVSSVSNQNKQLVMQLTTIQTPAPNGATYKVRATISASGATGQLVYFPDQNLTVLVIRGLPQPQGRQVYQGWLIQGQQAPTSVGLLNFKNGTASVAFPGDVTTFDMTAVSRELGPTASARPNMPLIVSAIVHY